MWKIIFIFFILMNILALRIPKKLSSIENYTTSIFALLFGIITDIVLNLKYHLYGYFGAGFQWLGLVGEFLYFIPTNVLFLNLYPVRKSLLTQIAYILVWSGVSTLLEYLIEKSHFFNYHDWNLLYSAILYPIIFIALKLHLSLIKKLISKSQSVYPCRK